MRFIITLKDVIDIILGCGLLTFFVLFKKMAESKDDKEDKDDQDSMR